MSAASTQEIKKTLETKTKDLFFMSESDYPFEIMYIEHSVSIISHLYKLSNKDVSEKMDEISLPYLFRNAIKLHESNSPQDIQNVQRYRDLMSYLKENLHDIKVYRIGQIQVDIFITGITKEGNYMILATKAIET